MNTTALKVEWEEQKSKLIKKFAVITGNELLFSEGKKDEMLRQVQLALGKTKEELQAIISGL